MAVGSVKITGWLSFHKNDLPKSYMVAMSVMCFAKFVFSYQIKKKAQHIIAIEKHALTRKLHQ